MINERARGIFTLAAVVVEQLNHQRLKPVSRRPPPQLLPTETLSNEPPYLLPDDFEPHLTSADRSHTYQKIISSNALAIRSARQKQRETPARHLLIPKIPKNPQPKTTQKSHTVFHLTSPIITADHHPAQPKARPDPQPRTIRPTPKNLHRSGVIIFNERQVLAGLITSLSTPIILSSPLERVAELLFCSTDRRKRRMV